MYEHKKIVSVSEYDDDDEDEEDEESEEPEDESETPEHENNGEIFADISDWTEKSLQKQIKTFFPWYPLKQRTLVWALHDGDSIESELAVASLFFKINL